MKRVFTEYVRSLDLEGEQQDDRFAELWEKLRGALCSELRKRQLWYGWPGHLGVHGYRYWSADGSADPLDELTADCYLFIFVMRLRSLKDQLRVKDNIDGLVFLNIRNFVIERQREHDPLGFQIFQLVRSAVRESLAAGEIHLLAGDSRVRNDSLLGVASNSPLKPARAAELVPIAQRWNDRLLPFLATSGGSWQQRTVAELRRLLQELESAGVSTFRFKDLIDPLKADLRVRWAAILKQEGGEVAIAQEEDGFLEVVRLVRPDTTAEESESFHHLVACVSGRLEDYPASAKTRSYLKDLWQFLWTFAAGREPRWEDDRSRACLEDIPSQRRTAKHLAIPRARLPELYLSLGRLVRECQAASARISRVGRAKVPSTNVSRVSFNNAGARTG